MGLEPVVSTPARGGERAPDALLHGREVVSRVLAREVRVPGVEEHALAPAPVSGHEGPDLGAVPAAHDERPRRIRSEVYSEGERHEIWGRGRG
jgi:hypothetical protein